MFIKLFEKYKSYVQFNEEYPVADDDFIFSNVIINDDVWTVIDFEWVRFEKGSAAETISRAINNYLLPGNFRLKIKEWIDCNNDFDEASFISSRVLGDNEALSTIRHNIGRGIYELNYLTDRVAALDIRFQIYEELGDGFKEENSYYAVDIKKHGPNILLNIPIIGL